MTFYKSLLKYWLFFSVITVLLLTLSPFNFSLNNIGRFTWIFQPTDFIENLFLFFPIGLALMLLHKTTLKLFIAYLIFSFSLSLFIEESQLFLIIRGSQYWDVFANTCSLMLGLLFASWIKQTVNQFIIKSNRQEVLLISALILNSLIIFSRLMTNQQQFQIFELSLVWCSCAILVLIIAKNIRNRNRPYLVKTVAISALLIVLTLLPLVKHQLSLYVNISIVFIVAVVILTIIATNKSIHFPLIKNILLLLIILPLGVYIFEIVTNINKLNFSLLPTDKEIFITEARAIGAILVISMMLNILFTKLLIYSYFSYKFSNINGQPKTA